MEKRKLTVLAIDDFKGALDSLRLYLSKIPRWKIEFLPFADPEAGLAELARREVDVTFLDYMLGATNGLDVLKAVRKSGDDRPIIVLTGEGSESIAAEVMREGASDYLSKASLSSKTLERSVSDALEKYRLQQEIKKQRREIEAAGRELAEKVEQLEKSEKRQKLIFEGSPVGMILVNTERKVVEINSAALTMIKRTSEDVIGRTCQEIFCPDERDHCPIFDKGKTTDSSERTIIDSQGERVPVLKKVIPIEIEGKTFLLEGFVDISERKALEAQLIHSEKMASIGQLAAGVAHEINNPTGFVASNLNTLSEYTGDVVAVLKECGCLLSLCEELDGKAGEIAGNAKHLWQENDIDYVLQDLDNLIKESIEGTDRIRKIVGDLKDFSRTDKHEVEEININEAIDKTLNVAWNEIKYKAEVVKEYGDLPYITCLAGQIDQAILNILVNAAQAMKEKGTITIRTYAKDENVCVEISDTGVGIPPDIQKKIFDPFFTTKPVGKGTGLGLNITYNIIRQHNGDITVRSKPGEGTTFTISLPINGLETPGDGGSAENTAAGGVGGGI